MALHARLADLLSAPGAIRLDQAVPSFAPPPVVAEALAEAARDPIASRYTPDPGLARCREAIARDLARRHAASIEPDEILVTPGANAAFHFVANVLTDPGDRVHLLSPYYFNHAMSVGLLDGRGEEIVVPPDVRLDAAIDAGALDGVGAGLLVVVNPSNPTGRTLDRTEVAALVRWARAAGARLVVDETYLEYGGAGAVPSVLAVDGWREVAIGIGTFSKSLAMSGHRIGYLAATPEVITETLKVHDSAAVCAPHPAQRAVIAALEWSGIDAWIAERRREIARRVDAFANAVAAADGPFTVEAKGAFFAWLRHDPALSDPSDPWAVAERLAREKGVVTLPGAAFGRGGEHRVRVAVGNAKEEILRSAASELEV